MQAILASVALGAALAVAPILAPTVAQAQQSAQQPAAQSISDKELQLFARTQQEAQKTLGSYIRKIEQTRDSAQAQKLLSEGRLRMAETIEASGLTVGQYNRIAKLVEADADLRARVKKFASD